MRCLKNLLDFFFQAIAIMSGLCFLGSINLTQYGIQATQGALFLVVSENTFGPMYGVLAVFPQAFPLFMREKRSGNYNTVQYYVAHVLALVGDIWRLVIVIKLSEIRKLTVIIVSQ